MAALGNGATKAIRYRQRSGDGCGRLRGKRTGGSSARKKLTSTLLAELRGYRPAAAAVSFSMGAPTRLPHSVHEPS